MLYILPNVLTDSFKELYSYMHDCKLTIIINSRDNKQVGVFTAFILPSIVSRVLYGISIVHWKTVPSRTINSNGKSYMFKSKKRQ